MSLLKVVRLGDPVLRRVAEPIADPAAPVIRELAEAMIQTMFEAPGVGLAAPQVGRSIRMIVMRIMAERSAAAEEPEPRQVMALINPEVEPLGPETELGWEGCLSAPPLRGVVRRALRVRFKGLLLDGQPIEGEASGFQARILQHEVDHLNGIVYLDRMTDLSTLGYDEELQAAAQEAEKASSQAAAADNL